MANFEGFPTVATLFKLDNYVNKAKATENEILSTAIGGQMKKDVSVTNYEPVVVLDKSAYFPGEKVKGKSRFGTRGIVHWSFKEGHPLTGKPGIPKIYLAQRDYWYHWNLAWRKMVPGWKRGS